MRWGIFSDIHSNLEAFQAVLASFAQEHIDRYICLGDIVGYGANPRECIQEVKRFKPITVAGNHDWAACERFDVKYFNSYAQTAIAWTAQNITQEDKQYLGSLKLVSELGGFTIVHGSLHQPERFEYILDAYSVESTLDILNTQLCFIGHTHVPVTFIHRDGRCTACFRKKLALEADVKYVVNAGSVGQPRDGDPRATYVVYDSDNKEVEIKKVPYNIRKAKDKIIKAGLPKMLAERLGTGQ
ncbi:MAG: metallophosphoesterase family protein [Candidatus Omnitrophica bacterium]|nr:metallophosphoesterase family protein [Candidatus Omnitrophota bacterium]